MDGEVFNVQLMEQRTWAEYCQANGLPLSVSDSPDQKVNMATAKSVKLQSPTMLRKPSARPTPLKTPAAAVQRGTALPPAPQSARLDGDVDSPLVEYFSKDWQEV